MHFNWLDILILCIYLLLVLGIGLFAGRPQKHDTEAADYFLAGKGLRWWVIGASLIASNISAEQFIGMSGSGFAIGMGIASYEFMAAITLVVIAVFFLPVFLRMGIYTMPEFLARRFDDRVRTVLAIFWLLVFTFVNLSSILYLGALTIKNVLMAESGFLASNIDPLWPGIILLGIFAAAYSVYGGLRSVAITDVVQVVFLVGGGLFTTWIALRHLGQDSAAAGFQTLLAKAPQKFDMILDRNHPQYANLPGLSVLLGGMWVANLYYWGCNQYIIQRALAAETVREAQSGLAFAGLLKLLLPLIVVIPGIVAWVLTNDPQSNYHGQIAKPDDAYPWLLRNFLPHGVRGLAFAALVAAIVSSLASMMNSIATIFTMDIYRHHIAPQADESKLVRVGRIAALSALLIAMPLAVALQNLEQAFQFIQEFTGFVSPGALAIFLMGLFSRRATARGALWAAIATFVLSLVLKFVWPQLPFLDRMFLVFAICVLLLAAESWLSGKMGTLAVPISRELFRTSSAFKSCAFFIAAVLAFIYTVWW